jgi:hypothetical protein
MHRSNCIACADCTPDNWRNIPITLRRKSSLDSDSNRARNLVCGCDGDLVAELAKGSRQHLSTFLLFPGTHFLALLDESHPFMQDLPNYTTEAMGNGPNGGLIPQAGQQTPEYGLTDSPQDGGYHLAEGEKKKLGSSDNRSPKDIPVTEFFNSRRCSGAQ